MTKIHIRRKYDSITIGELSHLIDVKGKGLYAFPPESDEQKEKTDRLMNEVIRNYEEKNNND